jgi:hypothetical protein
MSASTHKRVWEAPVATALSIRSTANLTGYGPDNYLRGDNLGGPRIDRTAPLADVGALPVPSRSESVKAPAADQRNWDAPAVAALSL